MFFLTLGLLKTSDIYLQEIGSYKLQDFYNFFDYWTPFNQGRQLGKLVLNNSAS